MMVLSALDLNVLLDRPDVQNSAEMKAKRKPFAKAEKKTRTTKTKATGAEPSVLNRARCWALERQEHRCKVQQARQRQTGKQAQGNHKQLHGKETLQSVPRAHASASVPAGTRAHPRVIEGAPLRSNTSVHNRRRLVFAQLGLSRGRGPGPETDVGLLDKDTSRSVNAVTCSSGADQDVEVAVATAGMSAGDCKRQVCAQQGGAIDAQWGSDSCGTRVRGVAEMRPKAQTPVHRVSMRLDELDAQHAACSTAVDDSILSLMDMFRAKGGVCRQDKETVYECVSESCSGSGSSEHGDVGELQHRNRRVQGSQEHASPSHLPMRMRTGAGMVRHNRPGRAPTSARKQLQRSKRRIRRMPSANGNSCGQAHHHRPAGSHAKPNANTRRAQQPALSRRFVRRASLPATSKRGWVQRAMLTDAAVACNEAPGGEQQGATLLTLSERLALERRRAVTGSKR